MLYITGRFPYPLYNGDSLRAYNQIISLSEDFDIDIFSIEKQKENEPFEFTQAINKKYTCLATKIDKIMNCIMSFSFGSPFQVTMYKNKLYREKLWEILLNNKYDEVFIQLIRLDYLFQEIVKYRKIIGNVKITLDYVDALSLNMEKRSKSEIGIKKIFFKREAELLRVLERNSVKYTDRNIIISDRDADLIGERVLLNIIPNGVNRSFNPSKRNEIKNIIFFGNLSYFPNQKSVEYIAEKIIPILSKKYTIHIVGIHAPNKLLKYSNNQLIIHGFINDLESFCNGMDLAIFPIFYGSGLQNKVLESFAMGIPVVASMNVACAIENSESTLIVADNENEFIDAIVKLDNDFQLRHKMINRGKHLVDNNYSWNMINFLFKK